ncbi:hypothetical protein F383_21728 [Gossypium arboreum]|uniref:Uncharacterized protein n=2 Tax=Gossypium arboreum TaxID=29729 RepID=A0A0B0P285_GOSAR|nr:hypothetical protein F383_21728 [Gossypium arboreum]
MMGSRMCIEIMSQSKPNHAVCMWLLSRKWECLIIDLCLNSSYENEIKMCHDLLTCA